MPKQYCKWLLKNAPGGCSFSSGCLSAHPVVDSAPDAQSTWDCCRETGYLSLHWVPVLTEAAQLWQGWSDVTCQSLTRVHCPPRELSPCSAEDKQGHLLTSLLLPRQVPFPSIKTIIGRYFPTAQQVGSRTREELPLHGILQILKHPFLIELFISSPASPDVPLVPASLTSSGVKWQVQIKTC